MFTFSDLLYFSVAANVPLLILLLASSGGIKLFFKNLFFWNLLLGIILIGIYVWNTGNYRFGN